MCTLYEEDENASRIVNEKLKERDCHNQTHEAVSFLKNLLSLSYSRNLLHFTGKKFHYRVHNSPPTVSFRKQLITTGTITSLSFRDYLSTTLLSMCITPKWALLFMLSNKIFRAFSSLPCVLKAFPISLFFGHLSTISLFCERCKL